ncbi:Fe(3+)-hydroxamate ABC transporter permease FhuB [Methylopila sp. M107]|uniref:Fe(3+)-hydroxamate ABC transporter permease FhuB n=1 Tax=Methylopila sp. M107 TaxID=1101190 RepID=UPI00037CE1A7|nr:Fe(3+)-hydroxamate ABC transporter permease FhuB [Methylopila sp. M107]
MSDRSFGPGAAVAALLALGLAACAAALSRQLPPGLWPQALFWPAADDLRQLIAHYSMAPRAAVALIAGAGLALAGAAFQQALNNPLASPSTLGVSAGAHLALSVAALVFPELIGVRREGVAFVGASIAAAIVFLLSWRSQLAPLTVILAGMVTALFCGAAAAALVLFNERMLTGLYIWGSGSLSQQDWSVARELAPRVAVAAILTGLLVRPLMLLQFDDQAKSLGLSVARARLVCLAIAVALSASIVSAVGIIGFVGLAAPALARALGARSLRQRLVWGTAIGASLLFSTDALLQALEAWTGVVVPTGAATALIGAPTLLWLAPRIRATPPPSVMTARSLPRLRHVGVALAALAGAAALVAVASLAIGRTPDGGFALTSGTAFADLLPWRWPRTLASGAAGAMLAAAGVMLQRLTGNPIASPDVLGVSSGAALGLVAALLLLPAPGYAAQVSAATLGGLCVAATLIALGRRRTSSGEQLLLAGIALGAGVNALIAAAAASGDPRMLLLANWMAGSAYDVEPQLAAFTAMLAVAGLAASATLVRWLALAPLGPAAMTSVGISAPRATVAVLGLTSALTAAATMAIGPLSFAGLIAPHVAVRLGFSSTGSQLAGSALIGAIVMLVADWLGRTIYFPFQTPAGLIGMALAGPLLMWLLQRR